MKIEISNKLFNEEEIRNTPTRIKNFFNEMKDKKNFKFTTFKNPGYNQMIILKDINFYSFCSHHLLPFFGKAHIGYIPGKKICGISKLARLVDKFASKPQIQERMTEEIVSYLEKEMKPEGCICVVEGQHLCMIMRGVKKENSVMVTSAIRGVFDKMKVREEFFRLCKGI